MAYLDYNATTPADGRVIDAMMPLFAKNFGNPSSVHHGPGRAAARIMEEARGKVADAVGMKAPDVIFTSGATEANNLALIGMQKGAGRPIRVLAGATEHKSVIQTCRMLQEEGSSFATIPVFRNGTLDLVALEDMMSDAIDVVSVMAANSETGVINPVERAADIVHRHGAVLHCDATQAMGRIPFDAGGMGIDMVTLSSHKIYGPKGCGALVATREARRRMAAILHGGGQERDLRSGTPNVPAIAGFGEACSIAATEGLADAGRQRGLRDMFEANLVIAVPDVSVNGLGAARLPNTSNVRIRGALADAILTRVSSAMSTGSACASGTMEPSHVLVAMGLDREAAGESIRVSVGRDTGERDIDMAVSELAKAVSFVRSAEARPNVRRSA